MYNFLKSLLVSFFLFSGVCLTQTANAQMYKADNILEYTYYDGDKDSYKWKVQSGHHHGNHRLAVYYGQNRNLSARHDLIHEGGLGYFYLGDQLLAGGAVQSRSDKFFGSMDVATFSLFGGYNLLTRDLGIRSIPLPNGETYHHTRKMKLYGGLFLSTDPVYHSYILPFIVFHYEGEKWLFNLGIPNTMVAFKPTEKHTFSFTFQNIEYELKYAYKPFKATELSVAYGTEVDEFRIQSEAADDKRLKRKSHFYYRELVKLKAEHQFFKHFKAYAEYGYQIESYYKYGRSFSQQSQGKLGDGHLYRIGLNWCF